MTNPTVEPHRPGTAGPEPTSSGRVCPGIGADAVAIKIWASDAVAVIAVVGQLVGPRGAAAAGVCLLATLVLFVGDEVLKPPPLIGVAAASVLGLVLVFVAPAAFDALDRPGRGTSGSATGADPLDWRGRTITSDQLRGRDSLKNAQLAGASFAGLSLYRFTFLDAHLQGASFVRADLRETIWWGADLRGADLRGACLVNADLTGARLDGVDASEADISGARIPADARTRGTWPSSKGGASTACAARP